MSDAVQESIKFSSPARRCPYCHDTVQSSDTKCVCNACLAVSHVSCWDESQCCPSCAAPERLIQEGQSDRPSLSPGYETRRRNTQKGEEGYELAPEVQSKGKTIELSRRYSDARQCARYQHLLVFEGQEELRARTFELFSVNAWSFSERNGLILTAGILMTMLLIPATMGLSLLLIFPMVIAFAISAYFASQELKEEIAKAELLPVPVKIIEKARMVKDGFQHVVCALDAKSDELPESYYPINEDQNQRLVGIDVPPEFCRGLNVGDIAILVTHKKRAVLIEPVDS